MSKLCLRAIATACLTLSTTVAGAQSTADFYKGTTVNIIVGAGAGGGYDTYTRVLAKHMRRHVPGAPNIIVTNMPGAASVKAANFLYNVAPKDGSVFAAVSTTLPLLPLMGRKGLKFDVSKLNWIGSIGQHQHICAVWHTSPIKSFDDAKKREVVLAATGATGNAAVYPKIFNQVLGTKFKVLTGYRAQSAWLAMQRGETDGMCGLSYQTLEATNPGWLRDKKITILAQIGLTPHPSLKGVPMVLDMMNKESDRNIMTFLMIPQKMGRPYVAPPAVPQARLSALRNAFMATMADSTYQTEAARTRLKVEPIDHAEMASLVKRLNAMPKETIKRATSLLARKKKRK